MALHKRARTQARTSRHVENLQSDTNADESQPVPLFASHAAFRARSDVEMVQQSPSIMMISNKQSRSYKVRRSHGRRRERDTLTLVRLKIFICLERTVPAWVPLTIHRRSSAPAAFQDLSKSRVAPCVTATLALDKRLCSAAEPQ